MQKTRKIEKRTHSRIKPWFYLAIQMTFVWEIFWILTGETNALLWNRFEQAVFTAILIYLSIRSYKIFLRTAPSNKWSDMINADRFMRS